MGSDGNIDNSYPCLFALCSQVRVQTNSYAVTAQPTGDVYQYDVTIKVERDNVRVQFALELFKSFEKMYGPSFGGIRPVYDGRKALYTARRIPGVGKDPKLFKVDIEGETTREGAQKTIDIVLREVNVISMDVFGKGSADGEEIALQVLNTVARMSPSFDFSMVGRSFYAPKNSQPLGNGVNLWQGFYQSVRSSKGGLLLNLDMSATAYHETGPCVEVLAKILNKRDTREFERGLALNEFRDAHKYFSKLKVTMNHRGQAKKAYRILGLTEDDATRVMFQHEQFGEISVAEYFDKQYGIKLRFPRLPVFRVGSPKRSISIPIELCDLKPGQRYPRKLNESQTAGMVKATSTKPNVRSERIQETRRALQYEGDAYMKDFGVSISNEMITCNARILPPPTLEYHAASREKTLTPRDGGWNLRDKRIPIGKTLHSWSVIVFGTEREFRRDTVSNFITEFCRSAQSTGMNVTNDKPPILYRDSRDEVEVVMHHAWKAAGDAVKSQPQLIMCILPNTGAILYGDIKRAGETIVGIPTQCIVGKHIHRPNRQYCANVTLKVNCKLGGTNVQISGGLPFVSQQPTMVVGCDVTHPDPGNNTSPSICAVVASWDLHASQYNSIVRAQPPRVEVVGVLEEIMVEHFKNFYMANNGRKPTSLIFFRDGVSQGQFQTVCLIELKAIFRAWRQLEKTQELKVTFIIVQKRHHTRFFPTRRDEADRNGNVMPGTVVDEQIVSGNDWDFFLNSHGSIQGTSRPTHYHVIHDNNGFTVDGLQNFIYQFCYTFCRATRAVSIVPAAYYADLLAYRARFHSKSRITDTSSQSERSVASGDERDTMSQFAFVKQQLQKSMYFV